MRWLSRMIFVAALSTPAIAADNQVSLTVNDIVGLGNALAVLDGYDHAVKDGTQDRVIKEPYKFGPGVRLSIAHDLTTVKAALADVQAAARGFNGDKAAVDRLGFEKQTLTLAPISAKDLSLDQNPIPPSVLSAMSPILVD